ncbi:MAG: outer membrane protein assembly factor BamC [Pantoea sp. Brub]|nr:outer membrane protein assembly factor BamC [Pantoea sp. Brub]
MKKYLVISSKKIIFARIFTIILLLSSCSHSNLYKRLIDNDYYLKHSELKKIKLPKDIVLIQYNDYNVPSIAKNNDKLIETKIDITPPIQPLALINDTSSHCNNNVCKLSFNNKNMHIVWLQILDIIKYYNIKVTSIDNSKYKLITDLIHWPSYNNTPYIANYDIQLKKQNNETILIVKLIKLYQKEQPIINRSSLYTRVYTITMMNNIINSVNKTLNNNIDNKHEEIKHNFHIDIHNNNSKLKYDINIKNEIDDNGLPILILNVPYNVIWKLLPIALHKMGITIINTNHVQGTLTIDCKKQHNIIWNMLNSTKLKFPCGKYQIQLGDLNNNSSMQVSHYKGYTLKEPLDKQFVLNLKNALNE